jgi:hypothetical protein
MGLEVRLAYLAIISVGEKTLINERMSLLRLHTISRYIYYSKSQTNFYKKNSPHLRSDDELRFVLSSQTLFWAGTINIRIIFTVVPILLQIRSVAL